jgi:Ca2+-binding RTX toxin-like protein
MGGDDRLTAFPTDGVFTLLGGSGNDYYEVSMAATSVVEYAGEGLDQIATNLAVYTLPSNVEDLIFHYAGPLGNEFDATGIGNALDNRFYGNDRHNVLFGLDGADQLRGEEGNDSLYGGNGPDTLIGGSGNDRFFFEGGETGVDAITDFAPGQDLIYVRRAGFGATAVVDFVSGTAPAPTGTNSALLYNTTTGAFSFDADGTGAGAAITLGQVTAGLSLSASDFVFY